MNPHVLDAPDTDPGALTRREALLRMGSAAMLTLGAVPFVLGGTARKASAQGVLTPQMIDALNMMILNDYVTEIFYKTGLETTGLIPAADRAVFQQLEKQEVGHVVIMNNTLSTNAREKPGLDFTGGGAYPDVFSNYGTFLALAQAFEDLGVRAYKGQFGVFVANGLVLTNVIQIHAVEGRHAAMLRRLRGRKPWITGSETDLPGFAAVYAGEGNTNQAGVTAGNTEAFDEPLGSAQVMSILDPFLT